MEELNKIWQANGLPGAAKLWSILKQKGLTNNYNRVDVERYISSQKVAQLHHKPVKAKHSYISTTAPAIMYCVDLLDMTPYARANLGVKWLLLCIDIFTRKAAIVATENKSASVIARALKEAFIKMGEYPKVVLSDQGSEFKGATGVFLKDNHIIHRTAEVGDHRRLGIVDRFSGVVKNWIAKWQTYNQSPKYVEQMDDWIDAYNESPHTGLGGMSPNEAWKYPNRAREYHYQKIMAGMTKKKNPKAIKVGDWVRIAKLKGVFDKGYHVKFSLVPHQVVEIKGLNYTLDNGKFYRAGRLLKVTPPEEEAPTPVRDVARESRRERKKVMILQAEGVDPVRNPELRRSARERKPEDMVQDMRYGKIKW